MPLSISALVSKSHQALESSCKNGLLQKKRRKDKETTQTTLHLKVHSIKQNQMLEAAGAPGWEEAKWVQESPSVCRTQSAPLWGHWALCCSPLWLGKRALCFAPLHLPARAPCWEMSHLLLLSLLPQLTDQLLHQAWALLPLRALLTLSLS